MRGCRLGGLGRDEVKAADEAGSDNQVAEFVQQGEGPPVGAVPGIDENDGQLGFGNGNAEHLGQR